MENYACQELKIHYLFSYPCHPDCIGNVPVPIASSTGKSILNLPFLNQMHLVPASASPCVHE